MRNKFAALLLLALALGSASAFAQWTNQSWSATNPLPATLSSGIAGERNPSSATNNYMLTLTEANLSVISKTTAVTIGAGTANDTMLLGLTVVAALTGTCVISGFADSDGTAQPITFPAATAAGFKDFRGAVNSAGALTVTCSNASDDNLVLVHWRAR